MTSQPSAAWFRTFPGPRIPNILGYVVDTWDWLRQTYGSAVTFERPEPELTDNLCQALNSTERRYFVGMDCDFQSETWELRREPDGRTRRVARADIRVTLGAPGPPHLVLEFKKLDGSVDSRRRYCLDGMSRFVDGKYAAGHLYGVMCGFICADLSAEVQAVGDHIAQPQLAKRLNCMADPRGNVITLPSKMDPVRANFDTRHDRPTLYPPHPIVLLHVFMLCPIGGSDLPLGGHRTV